MSRNIPSIVWDDRSITLDTVDAIPDFIGMIKRASQNLIGSILSFEAYSDQALINFMTIFPSQYMSRQEIAAHLSHVHSSEFVIRIRHVRRTAEILFLQYQSARSHASH